MSTAQTFHQGSRDIVRLVWARRLGLPDLAFADDGARLLGCRDGAEELVAVVLFGQLAIAGPTELVEAAAERPPEDLVSGSALLRLAGHGARGLRTAVLGFADDLPLEQPDVEPEVSRGAPEAIELEMRCPPDDVSSAGLTRREHRFTLMLPDGPAACAAYGEEGGLLADLSVLVAPAYRRRGLGRLVASIAAHEALADGLVVQVAVPSHTTAALRLVDSLGIAPAGQLASVRLGPRTP
ncbi:GNAT family N-acetyltransferase [Sinomonas flava]|uniref:GNAT family N-acetyltransferase n=1 Tax=Sinomonas flava TaxID=496857 RepID=UPI0039A5AFBD